jgi:ABC-type transport system involved in multi-copper enzyme maturation permease subunit
MITFPVIMTALNISGVPFTSLSVESSSMYFMFNLVTYEFFWTLGIAFSIIIIILTSGQISDEIQQGTMIMLISKPVSRAHIFFGKFLGVISYTTMLNFVSVFLSGWVVVLISSANLSHFIATFPLLIFCFGYGIFFELIFVGISFGFSSLVKKTSTILIILFIVVSLGFLGIFMVRTFTGDRMYQILRLYLVDFNYQFGNIFSYFLELFGVIPKSSLWQSLFSDFSAVYIYSEIDPSQEIDLGGLERTNYLHPLISFGIYLLISCSLMGISIYQFRKSEIAN